MLTRESKYDKKKSIPSSLSNFVTVFKMAASLSVKMRGSVHLRYPSPSIFYLLPLSLPPPSKSKLKSRANIWHTTRKRLIVDLTCLGLTGTRNGQASSCFSISAKIMRQGAMSLEACFRLACGRTSSLGGGVRGRLSSFSSSSSLNFRFRRGLLRFYD